MKKYIIVLAFLGFLITSCTQQNKINKVNIAKTYVDDFPGKFLHQQVFHLNDSISELAVKLDASKIPSLKQKQVDVYSLMTLSYAVYTSMSKDDLIQADTYKLSDLIAFDQVKNGSAELLIPLHLQQNKNYIILISVRDQVNKRDFTKLLRISKTENAPENFRVLNANNKIIWFPWIEKQEEIKIVYRYTQAKNIYVSYFEPKFSPAKPPFAKEIMPEGGFRYPRSFEKYEIELNNGISDLKKLPKEGAYLIHAHSNDTHGKLILQFYNGYPMLKNDAQKVFSLRYLNAKKEFNLMLKDVSSHTIKEFWFFEGRSKERSEEMMKTYYARVYRANELFTSYKEGWKTDRGMVFIIYGPPDHVYNEVDSEIWEYGGEADYNDLLFEFQILNTNMCNEDYRLIHQEDFKNSWYTVLENWRNN